MTTKAIQLLDHLNRFDPGRHELTAPYDVCQEGIGEAIGISRAHVSLVISRLESGLIESRLCHIKGYRRKKKAYFITHFGLKLLRETT